MTTTLTILAIAGIVIILRRPLSILLAVTVYIAVFLWIASLFTGHQ